MEPTFTNIQRLERLDRKLQLIPGVRARFLLDCVRGCLTRARAGFRFRAETVDAAEAFVAEHE